jgi:cystathionine beta-lyase family protein involved in aluminum resistance
MVDAVLPYRKTTPGMGRGGGLFAGRIAKPLHGACFFCARNLLRHRLKPAVFASHYLQIEGYDCSPTVDEARADIIQSICLRDKKSVLRFCAGIQSGSPIDSRATPEPWDMPGYDDQVIMAAGAFTLGASIELSADAPMRVPYTVWLQGGLTYPTGRAGVLLAADKMLTQD